MDRVELHAITRGICLCDGDGGLEQFQFKRHIARYTGSDQDGSTWEVDDIRVSNRLFSTDNRNTALTARLDQSIHIC